MTLLDCPALLMLARLSDCTSPAAQRMQPAGV